MQYKTNVMIPSLVAVIILGGVTALFYRFLWPVLLFVVLGQLAVMIRKQ